ncbi:hypothetical protein A6F68_00858 [Tsuneonella dongtanensis]|uniref:DUF4123 domain-containing protein n=1 Tax=Tsuneonella dongtanensis TaxID=692370 RepID=A0A1B2AB98_9SPHN|nr:DUF4123 domain-containing protein [Tsuneonella dongtanensis]ANY19384.1 hypothetical protein A6F68_00858 [Tsuneonella dongtanensis]
MSRWYAVVDGAADPRLYDIVAAEREHACLYSGDYDTETRTALPYLVAIGEGSELAQLWRTYEAGRFWGILIRSSMEFAALRRHLRHFTTARLPDGEIVLFRFWDPRIFDVFVQTETADQVQSFLAPFELVIGDTGSGGRRRYEWRNGLMIDGAPVREYVQA